MRYDRIYKAKFIERPNRFIAYAELNGKKETVHVKNPKTGEENGTGLPKSNVLYFELENDAWCCVRPSGTEPKIKFYVGVRGTDSEDAEAKMNTLMCGVRALAEEE